MLSVDGSEGSARAATVAFEIAEITGSKVFIVHVVPTPYVRQYALMSDGDPADVLRHYRENGEKLLKGYQEAAKDYQVQCELILDEGLPADRLVKVSKEKEVDIVVMGSRGASGKRAGMGSSVERVILGAECPIIVVK